MSDVMSVTYILVRVVCGVVLPLVQGQHKLGPGDQVQGGGSQGQDVIPGLDIDSMACLVQSTYSVRQEKWQAWHASLHPFALSVLHFQHA